MTHANTVRFKNAERLLRLALSAIDLIRSGRRNHVEIELLLNTLQRFKDEKLDTHCVSHILQMTPQDIMPRGPRINGIFGGCSRWIALRMSEYNIGCVASLVQCSPEKLKKLRWSQTSIKLLEKELSAYGLRLGMTEQEITDLLQAH